MAKIDTYLAVCGALVATLAAAACTPGSPVPDRPISYSALRFEATIRQDQDFTCGAASIATLLTFYWGIPTTEATVLAILKRRYTEAEIKELGGHGLSFEDLIFMAHELGFSAEGAKVPRGQLAHLSGPVIVHLDKGNFQHFVVLRRVGDGVYYVSDPVVGQLAMSAAEFASQYTGNALAIWKVHSDLPARAILMNPRDGIRVGDSLRRVINVPVPPFQSGL